MDALRRTALVAGAFYLITFISSIPAVFLLEPVLNDPDYIVSSGSDTRVLVGCFLDFINAIACIATAVVLFPVVKRQNEGVALGFVTARGFEAAIIVIGVVSLLSVVTLRQDLGGAGTDDGSLVAIGQSLVAIRDWTFLLGPSFIPGMNALLLGYLMYRSGLVPRLIPMLGLIGAPLLLTSATVTFFRSNDRSWRWRRSPPSRYSCGSCRLASGWSSKASSPPPSLLEWSLARCARRGGSVEAVLPTPAVPLERLA